MIVSHIVPITDETYVATAKGMESGKEYQPVCKANDMTFEPAVILLILLSSLFV